MINCNIIQITSLIVLGIIGDDGPKGYPGLKGRSGLPGIYKQINHTVKMYTNNFIDFE